MLFSSLTLFIFSCPLWVLFFSPAPQFISLTLIIALFFALEFLCCSFSSRSLSISLFLVISVSHDFCSFLFASLLLTVSFFLHSIGSLFSRFLSLTSLIKNVCFYEPVTAELFKNTFKIFNLTVTFFLKVVYLFGIFFSCKGKIVLTL